MTEEVTTPETQPTNELVAGVTPAGGGAPPPEAAPAPTKPAGEDPWYSSIEDPELRGVAESRHWKSAADAVRSYRELEKLRGVPEDRLLRLPEDVNSLEEAASVFERLGAPGTSDAYEVDFGDATDTFKDVLLKAKVTPAQAKVLSEGYKQFETQNEETFVKEAQLASLAAVNEMKSKMGKAFDTHLADVNRAAQHLELTQDELVGLEQVLGTEKMYAKLAKVGSQFNEAPAPGNTRGDQTTGLGLSPEGARAEIQRLKNDKEFYEKVFVKKDAQARERWSNLHKVAHP